ncbi:hypothetical protein Q5M85_08280 [Paraclostridium bifermentans]|nr:hypothetical protein [Paraclostridium bifermentans]
MKNVIIGTAGHIVYGKTNSTKKLTGRGEQTHLVEERKEVYLSI